MPLSDAGDTRCELTGLVYVYETPPIDWWHGWTPTSTKSRLFGNLVKKAAEILVTETSWEGDGGFYVSALPDPDGATSQLIVAVKQNNNGTCFLVSPFRLPWLEQHFCFSKVTS